jgi:hypothetical protein
MVDESTSTADPGSGSGFITEYRTSLFTPPGPVETKNDRSRS